MTEHDDQLEPCPDCNAGRHEACTYRVAPFRHEASTYRVAPCPCSAAGHPRGDQGTATTLAEAWAEGARHAVDIETGGHCWEADYYGPNGTANPYADRNSR